MAGLFALQAALLPKDSQSPLLTDDLRHYAAIMPEQPSVQTGIAAHERNGLRAQDRAQHRIGTAPFRGHNSQFNAPVRAIFTPALYYSQKLLTASGDDVWLAATLIGVLALFAPAGCNLLSRHHHALRRRSALRARAPPVLSSSFVCINTADHCSA